MARSSNQRVGPCYVPPRLNSYGKWFVFAAEGVSCVKLAYHSHTVFAAGQAHHSYLFNGIAFKFLIASAL